MIRNDEALAVQRKLLEHVERALEDLRADVLPKNPRNFEIYSEGYVEQINILKAQIGEYLARKQATVPNVASSPTTTPTDQSAHVP